MQNTIVIIIAIGIREKEMDRDGCGGTAALIRQ